MPRKPLIYIDDLPYHVMARSNNKDWFYLPKEELWFIFLNELSELKKNWGAKVYAFVLMDNHYHLLLSTQDGNDLGKLMCLLQQSVARKVNSYAGRINHVFGGPYKGSLVRTSQHYAYNLKYIYRNPVKAHITDQVEKYPFSTINEKSLFILDECEADMRRDVPDKKEELLDWLNTPFTAEQDIAIGHGLRRTQFKIAGKMLKCFRLHGA